MMQPRLLVRLLTVPVLAGVYFASAKAGLSFAFLDKSITLVWPPAGIALAAFLTLGSWVWPGIFLGAFLANYTTEGSVLCCLGIAAGNTLEGLVGAWLVNRFARGRDAFERAYDALKFAVLAPGLSTMVSATVGVGAKTLLGYSPADHFAMNWLTWWLGDAVGGLVVAPLVILWVLQPRVRLARGRLLEAASLVLFLLVLTLGLFSRFSPLAGAHLPLQFLCIPAIIWTAVRFDARATATATFAIGALSIWGTLAGYGPFADPAQPHQALLLLQAFLGSCAVIGLALAAAVEERRQSQEALTRQLGERKRLEEQLLQSQKMESIALLAGGIAHDFNNLLNTILGYGDLVLRELPSASPLRDDVREIRRAAERGVKVTRQLLTFSRRQVVDPQILDLSQVILNLEDMLSRWLGGNIKIETRLAPQGTTFRADRAQIEMVLMNLAINARDAMPQGGSLTIETCVRPLEAADLGPASDLAPGPYVELTVRDTGCGMDAATLSHLFEPFFTTKEKGKGTGLGLATVYGIVRQGGGRIRVASEPGKGSTFTVDFPRVEGTPKSRTSGTERKAPAAASARVLLVEDEPSLMNLSKRVLLAAGYLVFTADGPADARSIFEREEGKFDLLITDVVMPGMSGRQLADTLAQSRPGLRILYMSGYTDDDLLHHGVLEGMPFLQKPFTPEEFLDKILDVLHVEA